MDDQKFYNLITKWKRQALDLDKIAAEGCNSQTYVREAIAQAKVLRAAAFELEALVMSVEDIVNG